MFFCLRNLVEDKVVKSEEPWRDMPVDKATRFLSKVDYKARWFDKNTKHCLYTLVEGTNSDYVVSRDNPATAIHGFSADYDGVFTPDMLSSVKRKPVGQYLPTYVSISHSNRLHLVWLFSRPISVCGNEHANKLLHTIGAKLRAPKWGVGYDTDCELCTQVMDIGFDWDTFIDDGPELSKVPVEDVLMWDSKVFEADLRTFIKEVVDIPFDTAIEELRKKEWAHPLPERIEIGTRCVRFWAPDADNQTGCQFTKDGVRVYTPHDGGFRSWKSLLGAEFCDQYTARSMAPFIEDTYYLHTKDEYWRFFRDEVPPRFERRTEHTVKRDLVAEAMVTGKMLRGQAMSEADKVLYQISRRNSVDVVAPILYRPAGKIRVPGLGQVLNTSMVTVCKPSIHLVDVDKSLDAPEFKVKNEYMLDPTLCKWDNPFVTRGFTHIHKFLTSLFCESPSKYRRWIEKGCPTTETYSDLLENDQLISLISWMAQFYLNAAKNYERPQLGTALILAGKPGIGKSFFATEILGGLMGGWTYADQMYLNYARFTSDIVKYPVHLIDDKLGSRRQSARIKFTEALKTTVANGRLRCEAKFGSAVEALPWPGRIVILSNDDTQSLSVLPDLDMSTRDKFMMLKCGTTKYDFDSITANQAWLREELPYFARFLLEFDTPPDLYDNRFGVRAIQHPDMVRASAENGSTHIFVEIMESYLEDLRKLSPGAKDDDIAVTGNAVRIFRSLVSCDASFANELGDSRTVQQCLSTLYRNGGYNISLNERGQWEIRYKLRLDEWAKPVDKVYEV